MRVYLPVFLVLSFASPALAEPPAAETRATREAVTEAPLPTERAVPARDPMPATRIAGITMTAIGTALAGVGVGFAVAAADSVPEPHCEYLADTCIVGGPGSARDLDGEAETYSMLSALGLGIGLTTAAVGVVLVAVPGPVLEPSATVRLDFGPSQVGLSGSF